VAVAVASVRAVRAAVKTRDYNAARRLVQRLVERLIHGLTVGVGVAVARGLSLALLVARVGANHPHHAIAADDFAVSAHFLDRCSNFHGVALVKAV